VGIFATESVASEVLAGRRELTRKHIEELARFFKVSPAALSPATAGSTLSERPAVRTGLTDEIGGPNSGAAGH